MKKTLTALLLSSSALLTQAQDTYWALDGQKVFNTRTQAVITNTQSLPAFNYYGHFNAVFDKNADVLFMGLGMYPFPTGNGSARDYIDQAFTIPNKCNAYYTIDEHKNSFGMGAGHIIDLEPVNPLGAASGLTSHRIFSGGDNERWVLSAAKLGPSFERKIYHITDDTRFPGWGPGAYLFEYTIDKDGNVSGSFAGVPTAPLATNLPIPLGNYHMAKMSQDGKTIAYADQDGWFRTYHIPTGTLSWYGFDFGSSIPVMEQATVNGERRWYVSDGSMIGYYEEGINNFVDITPTTGTALTLGLGQNSSLALGRDGMMYFANGSGSSSGDLYYFDPRYTGNGIPHPRITEGNNCFDIPGAQIVTRIGSTYWFGNEVPGEDINAAGGPVTSPSMTVAGLTPAPGSYSTIYHCPSTPLWLSMFSPGNTTPVTVLLTTGDWDDGIYEIHNADYGPHTLDRIMDAQEDFNLINIWPDLENYTGFFSLTYRQVTPCGQTIEFTQVYEVVQISALADFYLTGPQYCLNALRRKTTTTPYNTPSSPPSSNCPAGWVGAITGGIQRTDPTVPPGGYYVTEFPDYQIDLEEYVPSTNTWQLLGSINATPDAPFTNMTDFDNDLTSNYFTSNYATITANGTLFRVWVHFESVTCGTISKFSYFRIIAGDPGLKYGGEEPEDEKNAIAEGRGLSVNTLTNAYPNPVTDKLNIDWYSSAEGSAYVSLVDVLGKEVYKQTLPAIKGTNRVVIDTAPLAAGVYRYTLHTTDGQSTGNIIRQ